MGRLHTIGIDIGGTNIKAGLFSSKGELKHWQNIPSEVEKGKKSAIKKIVDVVKSFNNKANHIQSVLGIAIAGIVDKKREILIHSPNLKKLDSFKIKEELSKILKMDVVLENDANAAAMGELWKGAGKKYNNFMLLTLGTGLGSGLVINKKLWTGDDGTAAEFGHTKIVPHGIKCGCGAKGCLEMYFSSQAIERMVKDRIKEGKDTILKNYPLSEAISPKTVYSEARNGDEVSIDIYREMSEFLGIAISNVINLLGIKTFIISGGISNAYDLYSSFLKKVIGENLFYPFSKDFTILKGKLGDKAGATGAAYLALDSKASKEKPS
jgi:glucokinase